MTAPRCTDPVAEPVLAGLLAALEVVYAEQGQADDTLVQPCEFEIQPGAIPVLDHGLACADGCEGMAWVRLVDVSVTDWATFPAPLARASRADMSYAVTVEVGVARCAPLGEQNGEDYYPPTREDQIAAANRAMVDAALVRYTILDRYPADNDDAGVSLGSYSPLGPEGDVVGGSTLCTVFVP